MNLPYFEFEFGTVHSKFKGFQYENTTVKLEVHFNDLKAGPTLYWWNSLITFSSNRLLNYVVDG
jgi:hypothetical protein